MKLARPALSPERALPVLRHLAPAVGTFVLLSTVLALNAPAWVAAAAAVLQGGSSLHALLPVRTWVEERALVATVAAYAWAVAKADQPPSPKAPAPGWWNMS